MVVGLNVLIFVGFLSLFFYMQKKFVSFNARVFSALILGAIFGFFLQIIHTSEVIKRSIDIFNIVGVGYVRLLQMMIYPIVVVSILHAMTKIGDSSKVGKSLGWIVFVLLGTTAVSAVVAIVVSLGFGFDLSSLISSATPDSAFDERMSSRTSILDKPFYAIFTDFISTNPFMDLTGQRSNSIASLVIFLIFFGVAYLGIEKKEPEIASKFKSGIEVLYKIVMRMVVLVLRLTPYGIFAIFTRIVATSDYGTIMALGEFVVASYIALFAMFIVHNLILVANGYNIFTYYKKVFSLLTFAFVTRSSAASIPLNIRTQTSALGVNESVATTGATFGAIMGQNGCAGIYPAMLAVCMAPTVGIDPLSISFLFMLVMIVTISSFGIAGVGGGATFAAIAVLSSFDMPLTLVAVLIGIEPLIDMGRTALNVNGSLTASLVSAKMTNQVDMDVYNNKQVIPD